MPEITKQDALRWLEMQRDAINTEIAYAAPDDKRQYFGNLKIVNWLADRVNEMTAVELLDDVREVRQICAARVGCNGCPFDAGCPLVSSDPPRRVVEVVKRWKEEQDDV